MTKMKMRVAMFGWLLAFAFTAAAGTAAAAEYCVGSVSELQTAIAQASYSGSALFTTVVRIQQGTYHVGNTTLAYGDSVRSYALQLLGGYNSDCSARVINADNTVFDGDGNHLFLNPLADLLIEGLRFQNLGPSGQLHLTATADDVTVRVFNNAFVGVGVSVVPFFDADSNSVSGYAMKFVNNRVHGYVKPAQTSLPAVYMAGLSQIRFTGNTIADNAGEHGLEMCADSSVWLVDNIGWNNSGDDFRVTADCSGNNNPGDARFRNNLYQAITLHSVGDSGSNIGGSDPLFVNASAGNYRLQNASPAINTGVNSSSMADIDLAGNPRVVGSTVDIGAYESAIDDTIATTLTVTNTDDGGHGSLRQAILDANANPDFTFINFNIPGSCPRVIAPVSADLPAITYGVRIDGFSQPGSAANTRSAGDNAIRCILLAGGNGRTNGLNFTGASTQQFWLQGVAFTGFNPGGGSLSGAGVRVYGGKDNILWGNQFGGALPGLTLAPNYVNVLLTGLSSSTLGGDAPAQRNVIAGAIDDGVRVEGSGLFTSSNNDIIGNLIGTYALESADAGNNVGVHLKTSGNTVRGNVIVNSSSDGMRLDVASAHDNLIQDNRIGVTDVFCSPIFCSEQAAGNGRDGLLLFYGPHDNIVYKNRIHNNLDVGIDIGSSSGAVSNRNWLIANSLYANGAQGTFFNVYNGTDNDAAPAAANMANRGLNYPVILRAYGGAKNGRVEGTLASTNGSYVLDIFSSAQADSGYPRGEGDLFHRSFYSVTINNALAGQNGSGSFSVPFPSSVSLSGRVITLTAADASGNTSELSAPVAYLCDVIFRNGIDDAVGDQCLQ